MLMGGTANPGWSWQIPGDKTLAEGERASRTPQKKVEIFNSDGIFYS